MKMKRQPLNLTTAFIECVRASISCRVQRTPRRCRALTWNYNYKCRSRDSRMAEWGLPSAREQRTAHPYASPKQMMLNAYGALVRPPVFSVSQRYCWISERFRISLYLVRMSENDRAIGIEEDYLNFFFLLSRKALPTHFSLSIVIGLQPRQLIFSSSEDPLRSVVHLGHVQ